MGAASKPLPPVLSPTSSGDAKVLVLDQAANELVFGVAGHVGSGTSMIAAALKNSLEEATLPGGAFEVYILKARDLIKRWAGTRSLPIDDDGTLNAARSLQDFGDTCAVLLRTMASPITQPWRDG